MYLAKTLELAPTLVDSAVRKVDVRLIAATNRNLHNLVASGGFRSDLYYRLKVVKIDAPPLRGRVEDIEPIALHLLAEQNKTRERPIKGFEPAAMAKLVQHRWPGNVRELKNAIEAASYCRGDFVTAADLVLDEDLNPDDLASTLEMPFKKAQESFRRHYIRRLLARSDGNKSRAAKLAEIDRSTVYQYLPELSGDP